MEGGWVWDYEANVKAMKQIMEQWLKKKTIALSDAEEETKRETKVVEKARVIEPPPEGKKKLFYRRKK